MSDRPIFHAALGRYFVALRKRRGLTQRQAGQIAESRELPGLTRQVLLRLESGKTKHFDADVLRSVAALYREPIAKIVARCCSAQYGVRLEPSTEACQEDNAGLTDSLVAIDKDEVEVLTELRKLSGERRARLMEFCRSALGLVRPDGRSASPGFQDDARPGAHPDVIAQKIAQKHRKGA